MRNNALTKTVVGIQSRLARSGLALAAALAMTAATAWVYVGYPFTNIPSGATWRRATSTATAFSTPQTRPGCRCRRYRPKGPCF